MNRPPLRGALRAAAFACCMAAAVAAQAADSFPQRPIRVVLPFAAGGVTDALLRLLQEPVGKALGQPLVIDNRPGAAGAIAATQVASAPADGYTLLVVNTGLVAITPFVQRNDQIDPRTRFTAVTGLSSAPSVLLVHPSVPATSVSEFVAYAKANPNQLEYATVGKGAYGDLTTAIFSRQAGIRMLQVPYQGNAQTLTALLSGEVKVQLTILSSAMNEQIRNGKLRALGVATAAPTPLVPGVLPIAATLHGFEAVVYTGIVAPIGTPQKIIEKTSRAIRSVLAEPAFAEKLRTMGMESAPLDSPSYAERIAHEIDTFAPFVADMLDRETNSTTGR